MICLVSCDKHLKPETGGLFRLHHPLRLQRVGQAVQPGHTYRPSANAAPLPFTGRDQTDHTHGRGQALRTHQRQRAETVRHFMEGGAAASRREL